MPKKARFNFRWDCVEANTVVYRSNLIIQQVPIILADAIQVITLLANAILTRGEGDAEWNAMFYQHHSWSNCEARFTDKITCWHFLTITLFSLFSFSNILVFFPIHMPPKTNFSANLFRWKTQKFYRHKKHKMEKRAKYLKESFSEGEFSPIIDVFMILGRVILYIFFQMEKIANWKHAQLIY